MKLYACTNFKGHWPVGVAAIVIAPDRGIAHTLLLKALGEDGLKNQPHPLELREIPTSSPIAIILASGEY